MHILLLQNSAVASSDAYKFLGSPYADWAMALGGIATFLTLIYLIRSGRGQQVSINAISNSLGELTKHSTELAKQSQEMIIRNQLQNQFNSLMSEQVGLMREMHLAGKLTSEAQQRMLQLEEDKRRIELKPVFGYTSALADQNNLTQAISVINYGRGEATIQSIIVLSGGGNIQFATPQVPFKVGPNGSFFINCRWSNIPADRLTYELEIKFLDLLNNEYITTMKYSPSGIYFSDPQLIK